MHIENISKGFPPTFPVNWCNVYRLSRWLLFMYVDHVPPYTCLLVIAWWSQVAHIAQVTVGGRGSSKIYPPLRSSCFACSLNTRLAVAHALVP